MIFLIHAGLVAKIHNIPCKWGVEVQYVLFMELSLWHTFHFDSYLPAPCKYSYTGQGESSLQNFVISTDVKLEGESRGWPDLVHDVNHVIL